MQLTRRADKNFDMQFGNGLANFAVDSEATAQNVRTRLQLLLGEWFLDITAGVPYLQSITPKPVDLALCESIFKQTCIDTDGVDQLVSFRMNYDSTARSLSVFASLTTVWGDTINIQVTQ
jgi:hypothetical protein